MTRKSILITLVALVFSCSENGKKEIDSGYVSKESLSPHEENKPNPTPLDTVGYSHFFSGTRAISFEQLYKAGNSSLILFQSKKFREDTLLSMDSLQNPAFSHNLVSAFKRIGHELKKKTTNTSTIKVVVNKNLHLRVSGNETRAIALVDYGGENADHVYNGFIFFDFNQSQTFFIGFNRLAGSIPGNNKVENTYFIFMLTDGFVAKTGAFYKDGIAEKIICADGKNMKYYQCSRPNDEMEGSLGESSMNDIVSLFEKSCTQSSLTLCGQLNWDKTPVWNNIW